MRVITGTAKGRKLLAPTNMDIRPTTDNVKESIFNIINFDIEDRTVLDLFAGTGQLGIEAISRGAKEVTFVDNNEASLSILRKNLDICHFYAKVIKNDSISFLKTAPKYDLIFIDPPYDSDLYEEVFANIQLFDLLSVGGIIITESRKEKNLPEVMFPYIKLKEYIYGKIKIVTYTRET